MSSTPIQLARRAPYLAFRDGHPSNLHDGDMLEQRIVVSYDYPVYFTESLADPANFILLRSIGRKEPGRRHRFVVVMDRNVAAANPALTADLARYAEHHRICLELAAPVRLVDGGEEVKNDHALVGELQRWLHELHIDRQSCVVIIGGGAVLDMVGYAAATSHRGVRVVRVPTTVLSQNDSGVGVKTAINAFGAKNYLGTFTPPFAVINDYAFIETLPARDRVAGMAEAVKVAAIRDVEFFDWLGDNAAALASFQAGQMQYMIKRAAQLHMRHIAGGGDPFEFGSARPLDFGHWAAHKLESMTDYMLSHGEAVAIGLALDTRYSVLAGMLDAASCEALCALLESLGFTLWHDALDTRARGGARQLLDGLDEFREHLGGDLTITLLEALGRGREVHQMDAQLVDSCIEWLKARNRQRCN
jgi:3-dehydroquinate synthase